MAQLIKNEHDQWVVRCDYSADDIRAVIEDLDLDVVLTEQQIYEVLESLATTFDLENGIDSYLIEASIEYVLGTNPSICPK
jgi:hypothetical protein